MAHEGKQRRPQSPLRMPGRQRVAGERRAGWPGASESRDPTQGARRVWGGAENGQLCRVGRGDRQPGGGGDGAGGGGGEKELETMPHFPLPHTHPPTHTLMHATTQA